MAAAKPKWYMGYSDNTNFTFLLTTLCDVASIYGPCAGNFGMQPRHRSIQDAFDLPGQELKMESYGFWEREKGRDGSSHRPYRTTEPLVLPQLSRGQYDLLLRPVAGGLCGLSGEFPGHPQTM